MNIERCEREWSHYLGRKCIKMSAEFSAEILTARRAFKSISALEIK
jgi:hypothetical protein